MDGTPKTISQIRNEIGERELSNQNRQKVNIIPTNIKIIKRQGKKDIAAPTDFEVQPLDLNKK